VLDGQQIVYCAEGKQTVIIPAFIFNKDRFPVTEESKSRSSSQAGSIASVSKGTPAKGTKDKERRTSSPDKHKRKLMQLGLGVEEEVKEEQIHSYVIEAFVLRDSWPLTRKEWDFAENHKNVDRIEKEMSSDSVGAKGDSQRGNSGKGKKGGGGTRQESRAQKTRPPSTSANVLDTTKANWSLRVMIDNVHENAMELRRDTQREEEIKNIKSAWETMEPGRSAKALLSRQKYLETHTVLLKATTDEIDDNSLLEGSGDEITEKSGDEEAPIAAPPPPVAVDNGGVLESPLPSEPDSGELFHQPPQKENQPVLLKFDASPYVRSLGRKILLDETEEERQQTKLYEKISDFEQVREAVLRMRENDRNSRNLQKERQLAEYERLQVELDLGREELHKARETYRKQFLPAEIEPDQLEVKTPSPKPKASKSRKGKK